MDILFPEPGSIILAPHPFTDRSRTKWRPNVVLSTVDYQSSHYHVTMAMITTAKQSEWPSDIFLKDWDKAGLDVACCVRSKIVTVDSRLVDDILGKLSERDWKNVRAMFRSILAL